MRVRFVLKFALILLGLLSYPAAAQAQPYPNRTVKIMVPYVAGGTTDLIARLVAEELQGALKQAFIVENRPGAAGVVAHKEVVKSGNDGYTLLFSPTGPLAIMPHAQSGLGYDPLHAFAPIKLIASSPLVLLVNPKVKANTVAELVSEAKEMGGRMTYGSWGDGSIAHLATEMFKSVSGAPLVHVPYKGSGQAMTDLLGGHIDMGFEVLFVALPHIQAGRLKAIALTTTQRSELRPEIPTMTEGGYATMVIAPWFGLLAPAGTPAEIVNTLSRVLDESLAKKSFQEKLLAQGAIVEGGSPEKFADYFQAEYRKWGNAARTAGLKPQ